ncbi:MAG: hypothetical protein KIS76_06235 [Pyrinomonadaceae bacterium]|nr:hypothetical protein [Pyrinomonadaceae bacterium]
MDKRLVVLTSLLFGIMALISFPNGALSVLLAISVCVPAIFIIEKYAEENSFLINVFLIGLILRLGLGTLIHFFNLRDIFGPDAHFYDAVGARLVELWQGLIVPPDELTELANNPSPSGWGMFYLVAVIYWIFTPSIFVAQTFCGIVGALTAPLVFICARKIFSNRRVAVLSAILVAVFPSSVIWSSQLLKDGLIIFLLVCSVTAVLYLHDKFSYGLVFLLVASIFGILALRFYIFFMVAVTIVGTFMIPAKASVNSIVRNTLVVVLVGLSLTYLGVIRNASSNLERFGNLRQVQNSRLDLAQSADSGFGAEIDVSTPVGAISAVPFGLMYLYFAPFPWEVAKLQQVLVLPETLLWWMLFPLMISGLLYSLKNRLRKSMPVILFILMLSLSYAIFQGNVGMIYRQRTQIQVFLFMLAAVGWTLRQEKKENRMLETRAEIDGKILILENQFKKR